MTSSQTCKCFGCGRPRHPGYEFCGRTCGSGNCVHKNFTLSPSNTSNTCKCFGCEQPCHPGYEFCGRTCGSGACGHPPQTNSTPAIINFYHINDPYYEFTNFYRGTQPINIDNKYWPTSEHYFQAQKFLDKSHQEAIRCLPTPRAAFDYAHHHKQDVRSDWTNISIEVMRHALRSKFSQDPFLKKLLLDTGDAELINSTERDNFWGDGGDGSGENNLGKLLQEVRHELKNDAVMRPMY